MFGYFRRAAFAASLGRLCRGLETLILMVKRGARPDAVEARIETLLIEAGEAISTSQKTSRPLDARGVISLCETLMCQKQIRLGTATDAVLTFYHRLLTGPHGQMVSFDLRALVDQELARGRDPKTPNLAPAAIGTAVSGEVLAAPGNSQG